MGVVSESLGDVEGLHSKLDRRRSVDRDNKATKEQFHQVRTVMSCMLIIHPMPNKAHSPGAVQTSNMSSLLALTSAHISYVCVLQAKLSFCFIYICAYTGISSSPP